MLMVSDLIAVARGDRPMTTVRENGGRRFDRSRAPVVVWNVLSHCDMRCPHCYAAASSRPSPRDLSREECVRILNELAASGVRVVIFSGGEPLLRPDLLELIETAGGLGLTAHLSTNGVHLLPEKVAALKEAGLSYVGVSIDGREEDNDAYRGMQGGFRKAVQGLSNAHEAALRTGLRMTLTERNAAHVGSMLDLAVSLQLDRFYLSHLVPSGRGRAMIDEDVSPEQAREVLVGLFVMAEVLLEREVPTRVVTGANDSDGALLLRWIREWYGEEGGYKVEQLLRARGGNSAGEGVLCIDSQGRVHPDPFWRNVQLGDLRRQPFKEVLEHPLIEKLRNRELFLEGRCGGCAWLNICRGAHRGRAEAATGSMWGSDPGCVVTDTEIAAVSS